MGQKETAINYRTRFAYRIDAWDADGENVIEQCDLVETVPRNTSPPEALPQRPQYSPPPEHGAGNPAGPATGGVFLWG